MNAKRNMKAFAMRHLSNQDLTDLRSLRFDQGQTLDELKIFFDRHGTLRVMCDNCVALRDTLNRSLIECVKEWLISSGREDSTSTL